MSPHGAIGMRDEDPSTIHTLLENTWGGSTQRKELFPVDFPCLEVPLPANLFAVIIE